MTYLDTHVALWLSEGNIHALSEFAGKQIQEGDLLVSPIVILEMEYLHEIRRIALSAAKVLEVLSRDLGLRVCDLPFQRVIEKALPLKWVRDPFDRLIVAQADANSSPLVTKDLAIRQNYARAVW